MFAVGALLLVLFTASVVIGRVYGHEKTTVSRGGESQHAKAGAAVKETTKTGAKEGPKTNESRKSKNESSKEVNKDIPPEGVLLALLGTGVALILCGGLYSRLTTIKLPGNVELDLSSEPSKKESEDIQNAVVEKALRKEPGGPDPKSVAEATAVSHEVARAHKRATGKALSPEIIALAAEIGVKTAFP
jgi:hypothetical protein